MPKIRRQRIALAGKWALLRAAEMFMIALAGSSPGPTSRPCWRLSADGQVQLERRWLQRRQTKCCARGIAIGVLHTLAPRGVELAAHAGALLIDRAMSAFAHFALKAAAARGFLVGPDHRHACGVDLHHQVIGHRAPRRGRTPPQKKDTRKCEQQAPQFRHGLASDMGVFDKESKKGCDRKARHSNRAMAVGKSRAHLYFS